MSAFDPKRTMMMEENVRGVGIDTAGVDPDQTCSPWQLRRSREPVAIGGRIPATILQFERFRIDVSDSAFTGRTS